MTPLAMKAAECVKSMLQKPEDEQKEYLSWVRGLGSMIMQNGLAGAVLFLKVKKQDVIIDHLKKLLSTHAGLHGVIEQILNGDKTRDLTYMKGQLAALEGVKWLRRYAEIFMGELLKKEEG